MTRKDYEMIASVLNEHLDYWKKGTHATYGHVSESDIRIQSRGGQIALRDLTVTLAYELSKTNPRFDKKRFLDACGVN